jgi:hypothetical protein
MPLLHHPQIIFGAHLILQISTQKQAEKVEEKKVATGKLIEEMSV